MYMITVNIIAHIKCTLVMDGNDMVLTDLQQS